MSTTLPPVREDGAPVRLHMLTTPVTDASAWVSADYANEDAYVTHLTPEEIEDADRAIAAVKRAGLAAEDLTQEDQFPLGAFGRRLKDMQRELEDGRGFTLLRGFPVERYAYDEQRIFLMGIIVHLGEPMHQDTAGTLVEEVLDRGLSYSNIQVRGYMTRAELTPHCDSGDAVCLLCIRPAKSGGISQITSGMSIYNEILRSHPEYLELLYRGFRHNIRGNGPVGEWENVTRHYVPVFSYHEGRLSSRYNLKAMLTAEELPGVEPLSDMERNAITTIAELAMRPDLRLDITLRAGDVQMLNNHMMLHTRTSYEDFDEPDKKRFLIRSWSNMPNSRPLVDAFADHFNTGPRGAPALKLPLL